MGGQIVVVIVLALLAGVGGGFLSRFFGTAKEPRAHGEGRAIRATNIALVDELDRERAVLKLVEDRPMLVLSDQYMLSSGDKALRSRFALGILADGAPGIEVTDPNGRKRIVISLAADGTAVVELAARNTKAGMKLSVSQESVSALTTFDEQGRLGAKWP
jgi:hypothetical protein